MKEGAGRPTDLTEDLLIKIKQDILDGKNLKEIAQHREIPEVTIYTWHSKNYIGLADKIEGWKRDRKLNMAEVVLEDMLSMPVQIMKSFKDSEEGDEYLVTDPGLVRIKQDTAKFVAETLGKKNYAKRNELTGAEGKDLLNAKELVLGIYEQGRETENTKTV